MGKGVTIHDKLIYEPFFSLFSLQAFVSAKHEEDKVIVFERGRVLFIFNFNASKSFQDYRVAVETPGTYPLAFVCHGNACFPLNIQELAFFCHTFKAS